MLLHRSLVLAFTLGLVATAGGTGRSTGTVGGEQTESMDADGRSNMVVVLLDDMSANLLHYMNETTDLAESSVVFDSFLVSNPLCCPSRATIQTGKYPHNSRVRSNWWPVGGFGQFYKHDLETSLGPYLEAAGYRTGFMGKYMNGYMPAGDHDGTGAPGYPAAFVPPGWDEWFVTGNGYNQFEYRVVVGKDGQATMVDFAGHDEDDYLTDVLAGQAEVFIEHASAGGEPFFLMIAPFAVHGSPPATGPQVVAPDPYRFPAAPRDRVDSDYRADQWSEPDFPLGDCGDPADGGCADVLFPDPINVGNFNVIPENPPIWAEGLPLSPETITLLKGRHIERIQMIQSADDLVRRVLDALDEQGASASTYVVVTDDNGYHLGDHALPGGKSTSYDHDVRVPLVIHPPGGTEQVSISELVQNTDLLPTFLEIAGAPIPDDVDGVSLLDLVRGTDPGVWRQGALIEFDDFRPLVGAMGPDGPDEMAERAPPSYHALRTHDYLFVDYSTLNADPPPSGFGEFYDLRSDPDMIVNIWDELTDRFQSRLNDKLRAMCNCAGPECWQRALTVPSID